MSYAVVSQPIAPKKLGVVPVLDFRTEDDASGYFARGFIEDLIIDLSRYSSLGVIDSHSSFSEVVKELSDREVAEKLGADYLLKVSFRRHRRGIRLGAQLLAATDNRVLWADRYDAPDAELFDVQDRVIEQVTSALSKQVDLAMLSAARKKPVPDLGAYDCWLRGYEKLSEGSVEADAEARSLFEQSLEIDPHYARAHAGISLSHFNDWSCQAWELADASECFAYDHARQAIKLDEHDHVAHYVLARVLLYRREFERSETHLDRSLALNPNDADSLVQISFCKAMLGHTAEAQEIYERAVWLNPLHDIWYLCYGSVIPFIEKRYDDYLNIALRLPLNSVWLDLAATIAAVYGHKGDLEKAAEFFQKFRELYREEIRRGADLIPGEEFRWLLLVNPFRRREDIDHLAEGLRLAGAESPMEEVAPTTSVGLGTEFRTMGEDRKICFAGKSVTLPEVKGFADIEQLIRRSGEEIHCSELMGGVSTGSDSDVMLDEKARASYRDRIRELQADLEEAEERDNPRMAGEIREELDALLDHLARASGLGGRSRKLKDPNEKARSAVTWRIRSAIKKIAAVHPELGKHFGNAVRTGVFCSYSPEKPVDWML